MKLIKKIIAASSLTIGSILLYLAVNNLEFQEYTDSPLFDWKILYIAGLIALIPGAIYLIRREMPWQDNH